MATIATTAVDTLPKRPNAIWQFIKAQPFGMAGLFIILIYVVCAFGAAYISPFNPEEIDFAGMLSQPSATHWFGTDQYGRDVFSRIVYGSRPALARGILSVVLWRARGGRGSALPRATSVAASIPPSSAWSISCCRFRSSCGRWWWWPCSASARHWASIST